MNINYMACTKFYKCFHNFLGFKHKAFEIQIADTGWYWWGFEFNRRPKTDHAGFDLDINILGIEFMFDFYDYRHWNDAENRFYFEEEPEFSWIGYKGYSEADYWRDIEKTAKIHNLDEDYLCRCQATFMVRKEEIEEYKKLEEEWAKEEEKPFILDKNIAWENMAKAKDYRGRTCKLEKLEGDKVKLIGVRRTKIVSIEDIIDWLDIYDKKGNLLSKMIEHRLQ